MLAMMRDKQESIYASAKAEPLEKPRDAPGGGLENDDDSGAAAAYDT